MTAIFNQKISISTFLYCKLTFFPVACVYGERNISMMSVETVDAWRHYPFDFKQHFISQVQLSAMTENRR